MSHVSNQATIDWQCDAGICDFARRQAGLCSCFNKESENMSEAKGFLGRELPFECIVGDEPEVCENIFSGEKVGLPADAVAVYDVIMGSNLIAEKTDDPKMREKLYEEVRKGCRWFMKHEPHAYMVLLD